jgi:hypothetical protein
MGLSLRTPYTPFTAFVSRQDSSPSFAPPHVITPHTLLPEDEDNPLAGVYNQILRFIGRDVKDIMEIAEKVSNKKIPEKVLTNGHLEQKDVMHGFQILAHVVWEEVANAVINDLGEVVFAAGRPNDLRKVRAAINFPRGRFNMPSEL